MALCYILISHFELFIKCFIRKSSPPSAPLPHILLFNPFFIFSRRLYTGTSEGPRADIPPMGSLISLTVPAADFHTPQFPRHSRGAVCVSPCLSFTSHPSLTRQPSQMS